MDRGFHKRIHRQPVKRTNQDSKFIHSLSLGKVFNDRLLLSENMENIHLGETHAKRTANWRGTRASTAEGK